MTYLFVHVFLLMLGAFLLGAMLACIVRSALFGRREPAAAVVPARPAMEPVAQAKPPQTDAISRFERALAGSSQSGAPQTAAPAPIAVAAPVPKAAAAAAVVTGAAVTGAAGMAVAARPVREPSAKYEPYMPTLRSPAPPAAATPASVAARPVREPSNKYEPYMPALRSPAALVWPAADGFKPSRPYPQSLTDAPAAPETPAQAERRMAMAAVSENPWPDGATYEAYMPALGLRSSRPGNPPPPTPVAKAPPPPPAPAATPTLAPAPTAAAAPAAAKDDLKRIQSIDRATEAELNRLGVTRYEQIARWRADDVARADRALGGEGRPHAENWIEQAAILAKGQETYYSRYSALRGGPSLDFASWDGPNVNGASSGAAGSAPSAGAPEAGVEASNAAPGRSPSRTPDLSGMRSVRSEALRREEAALPPIGGQQDDLKRIRGVGVLIEKRLNSLAITTFEQIANWTSADIDRVGQILDARDKIDRENWVEQARILASGGHTAFSKRVQ